MQGNPSRLTATPTRYKGTAHHDSQSRACDRRRRRPRRGGLRRSSWSLPRLVERTLRGCGAGCRRRRGGDAEDRGSQRSPGAVARVLERGQGAWPVGRPHRGRGRARRDGGRGSARSAPSARARPRRRRRERAPLLSAFLRVRPRRRHAGARPGPRRRLGLHRRHQRRHHHQPARRSGRHQGHGDHERRQGVQRAGGRQGRADRRRGGPAGEATGEPGRRAPRRLRQARSGRVGGRGRQPAGARADRDRRNRQRQGPARPSRTNVGEARPRLHPDRREDQPRQLGRSAGQPGRGGGRRQHADPGRRGRRVRLRDSGQRGPTGGAGAGEGRAHALPVPRAPADRHQGSGRGAALEARLGRAAAGRVRAGADAGRSGRQGRHASG